MKRGEIRTMYEEGVERVQRCLEETKQLYKEVRRNRLDVAVEAYNATLDEAFPAFLKKYGVVFDAHNTMASIDYPLALDDMRLQGVFYMKQYLERLHMENKFCHLFDRAERMQLLDNFARVHRFDYRIELFNIFELMLHHAIFSILSGGESHRISISNFQFDRLKRLFHPTDRFRVRSLIHEALDRLLHDLQIREPEMKEYVRRCTGELVQRVVQTSRHDSLQSLVFADPKEPVRPASGISFHASDRMSDADLRKLIEKVLQCEHEEEKVRLIRSAVSSLYDYLDVLESDCLYGGEYRKLFATFSDTELAVLAKVVFYEELREGSLDFLNDPLHRPQYDREWESHLTDFFKRLNRSRLQSVERLIGQIRYEDISFY